jgi:hypothetical protein
MPGSRKGSFAVLPRVLAACALLAGPELASAQTVARDSDASVTAGVKANESTLPRDTTQSTKTQGTDAQSAAAQSAKTSGAPSHPQVKGVTPDDLKVPGQADLSLNSSDSCAGQRPDNVNRNSAIRPCHNYVMQDFRAPLATSSGVDEHRSSVILPGVINMHDDNMFDHFRLVDEHRSSVILPGASNIHDDNMFDHFRPVNDGPIAERKHWSLLWVERPDPRR